MRDNSGVTKIRWTMGEVISSALETFRASWKVLVVAQLLLAATFFVPLMVCGLSMGGIALLSHGAHAHLLEQLGVTSIGITAVAIVVLFLMTWSATIRMIVGAVRG